MVSWLSNKFPLRLGHSRLWGRNLEREQNPGRGQDDVRRRQNNNRGQNAEKLAATFLQRQGLKIIQHNMLNHCGEIDLIAQEKKELVFVEVRYRSNTHYGGPLASIDRKKQNKIKKTAQIYLRDNFANPPACRFDTLTFTSLEQEPKWVINAFC